MDSTEEDDGGTEILQAHGCKFCGRVWFDSDLKDGRCPSPDCSAAKDTIVRYSGPMSTFVNDMIEADLDVEHYQGRHRYEGPAVRARSRDDYDEIIRATQVKTQEDSMGLGKIIYVRG